MYESSVLPTALRDADSLISVNLIVFIGARKILFCFAGFGYSENETQTVVEWDLREGAWLQSSIVRPCPVGFGLLMFSSFSKNPNLGERPDGRLCDSRAASGMEGF